MIYVVIIELKKSKYFITLTSNQKFELDIHFNSNAYEFTRKYMPIKIKKKIKVISNNELNTYFYKYVKKYGIGNVRNINYPNINLSIKNIYDILNKCYII